METLKNKLYQVLAPYFNTILINSIKNEIHIVVMKNFKSEFINIKFKKNGTYKIKSKNNELTEIIKKALNN